MLFWVRAFMICTSIFRFRLGFAALILCLVGLPPRIALAAAPEAPQMCQNYSQSRLLVGEALQARRLVLEAKGEVQWLKLPSAASGRFVVHRTFGLSLDVTEAIALFTTRNADVLVIERIREMTSPLRIPVFFIGRNGHSLDELRADAHRVAFGPSALLAPGDNFADLRFFLRKGASRFDEVRGFFACGLPGLVLCEGMCPGDVAAFATTLAGEVLEAASLQVKSTAAGGKTAAMPLRPLLRSAKLAICRR